MFRNGMRFYDEELLAPRPTPKQEDHPLSASATAYSIYSQLPSISEAVPTSGAWGRAMPWWQGPIDHGKPNGYIQILSASFLSRNTDVRPEDAAYLHAVFRKYSPSRL